MIPYLESLNSRQREVVETTEGPVLVLAGAGSGKTSCVISRAAYLMFEKRVHPHNLLIVTFTNKAARELRDRLEATAPGSTRQLWVGTFHSICTRILRYEADALPFTSSFSIYDADDQKTLMGRVIKQLDLDTREYTAGAMQNLISRCKSNLVRPEDFFNFYRKDPRTERSGRIYRTYQETLLANNALDFDDILMHTAFLFDQRPDIRDKYTGQFRYVMIDEYQDTNFAQFKIIHQIAGEHRNLCVVGDDDQAIYSWRGASIKNILNFEADYGKVTTIRLEQNYRSTQPILDLANSLIEHNRDRHPKALWSDREEVDRPVFAVYNDEAEEAGEVAEQVLRLHNQAGIPWSAMAVLYRTNAQSRNYETMLMNYTVPFVIVGGVGFFQRREIKDMVAYMRALVNPCDNESLMRIVNVPARKIGNTTVERLLDDAILRRVSLWEAMLVADENPALREAAKRSVREFVHLIERWRGVMDSEPVAAIVGRMLSELGLLEVYRQSEDPQDETRAENLEEFMAAVEEFSEQFSAVNQYLPKLTDYLPNLALQTDLDQDKVEQDTVKLMTMHNAKGLEFEQVFVVGLAEGVCPHRLCLDSRETLEEERRLLYVAMTRAKSGLHLSYPRWRRENGTMQPGLPSRFISELDAKLLTAPQAEYSPAIPSRPRERASKPRRDVLLESAKFFKVGQHVCHPTYGEGVILNVDGPGEDAYLTISFNRGALKKIKGNYVDIGESQEK